MNGGKKDVENVVLGGMIAVGTRLKWLVSMNIFFKNHKFNLALND